MTIGPFLRLTARDPLASAMSPAAPDDDDRTVIRPQPATGAGGDSASAFAATQVQGPPAPGPAPVAHNHGDALPLGTCLGEFEITRVLGAGGFGIVYLATDHSLQRQVALKEYMPSALASRTSATTVAVKSERHRETFELGLRSFINEARLLAQFDHPSLVKVYRFWEANGTAYMVMPFYEGITLKDRLRTLGAPPDEAWLLGLLAPLTEALRVIHAQQCFHRDIAPDNIILLAGSGRPLLLDFGAARRVIGDMTQALTVILKPGYAPLEQYAEVPGLKQGPWTDVYALAAVVYYAILGKTPPPAVGRMMSDTCVPLAQAAAGRYSDGFLRAIDRALGVHPDQRTPSIDAFREDLGLAEVEAGRTPAPPSAARAGEAVTMVRQPAAPSTPAAAQPATGAPAKAASRMPWIAGAAAAALLIGGGAYWALTSHQSSGGEAGVSGERGAPPAAAVTAAAPAAPAADTAPSASLPKLGAAEPAPRALASTATPAATAAALPADEFERIVQGQSPGFDVRAEALRSPLRIDKDRLRFTVRSARDGYVYVIAHDPDGSTTLLFPNTQAADNRIHAGQALSLPQPSWPVVPTEPAGQERFLVLVLPSQVAHAGVGQPEGWFRRLAEGDASRLLASNAGPDTAYGAARFAVEIVR
jgi:hypothetical protein